jgi:hypothetical protein
MRRALLAFLIAVAPLACPFGGANAATPVPQPAPPKADVDRWIAEDAAALRNAPSGATRERVTHFASLLNGLWLAGRDGELARELASASARFAGASQADADRAFFAGDRTAAFAAYADGEMRAVRALTRDGRWRETIARLRTARADDAVPGRPIAAALLEGDAYAACGRWPEARTTWYRAFSTAVLQPPRRYRFFPEWTSAMRRLVRYRTAAGAPSAASGCRQLPPAVVDPVV